MKRSARGDLYGSLDALRRVEREEIDYRIRHQRVPGSSAMIIAPHGGGIEKRTSGIARAIAGQEFTFYLFEGRKRSGNKSLHVTSHRFEDRTCLSLLAESQNVVAVHGCKGRDHLIYLGGRDNALKTRLAERLRAAGYHVKTTLHPYAGKHPKNICNRGATAAGVQLELSYGLRVNGNLSRLASAVRSVLLEPNAA